MPQMRKLALEEVQALENKGKSQRKLVAEQYDAILNEYTVGDYGEAILEPGENRLTIRNRLRAAANRRNLGMEFKRTSLDLIRFHIVQQSSAPQVAMLEVAAREVGGAVKEPKKRGGRPKKTG